MRLAATKRIRVLAAAALLAAFACPGGCKKKPAPPPPPAADETTPSAAPRPKPAPATPPPLPKFPVSSAAPPVELWKEFSGARAYVAVKNLFDRGPRPAGSEELAQARKIIGEQIERHGWEVGMQEFTDDTPDGPMKFANLIARFSADGTRPVPRDARRIVLAAHYDTRRFSTIRFAGANDGAAGAGVLLEAARVLALDPGLAAGVSIVFFDGFEPMTQFSETDGCRGSRVFAQRLNPADARAMRVLVIDSVGANSDPWTLPPATPPAAQRELQEGAARAGLTDRFRIAARPIWGDHIPFEGAGAQALYLGNQDYMARYTADDTLARISIESLEDAGKLAVWLLKKWSR